MGGTEEREGGTGWGGTDEWEEEGGKQDRGGTEEREGGIRGDQ